MNQQNKTQPENHTSGLKDPGNILMILYLTLVIALFLLGGFSLAHATVAESDMTISMDTVRQGELLIPGKTEGQYIPAPLLAQDTEIYISGMAARTLIRQRFQNDSDQWIEAVYVFPLPDESAVDHMRMTIGKRVIEGMIKEKQEAQAIYNQARKEGKKTSLLSQERPNIFTMAVANIGPGEEVTVEIEYQQVVRLSDGIFSLRFPMVVGPRYIPGLPLLTVEDQQISVGASGWAMDTDQVPDASRITPPVSLQASEAAPPVRLFVELASGFPLSRVESLYHGIDSNEEEDGIRAIRFNGVIKADRDFVLEWQPRPLSTPTAALFTEKKNHDLYMMLMLNPPVAADEQSTSPPREVIFVLDTSGSMAGTSIVQARKALIMALQRLNPRDRFNIIAFSSSPHMLFQQAMSADQTQINRAIRFIQGLEAKGGTEIASALNLALDGKRHDRIRQVIFLTDGCIGNETALFALIQKQLADSRLFTIGIGSAPNSYFMSRAAANGRGTFTYIGKVDEVEEKMLLLFKKLEHPAITDLQLTTSEGALEIFPAPLPDLYLGEPLVVTARLKGELKDLHLSGQFGAKAWDVDVAVQAMAKRPGIAPLWARKKIRSLMDSLATGADKQQVRTDIIATAIEHHLVSKYTSLVAVEQKVSRPADKNLQQRNQKTNLPQGWQANKVFGGNAQTATPAPLLIFAGLLCILLAFTWKTGLLIKKKSL